ncbi:DJ-1/PfpI family protein [Mangrovivirga sp. M17]|uniref:DJ-1/PfpI family protein n=1 Tax=Mangrovivirga halotolerans TaxID=2993936 RepID=A0ABT3RSI0_9BACT|nr:DJ-1/PfpI family protein [Mangrovivirga halotolerans]MCX2744739.1 DJ-1/PfpI family protein [Mangrovivirga halotolerans]
MKNLASLLIAFVLFSCGKSESVSDLSNKKESAKISKDTLHVEIFLSDKTFNTELIAPMDIFQHTIYHTNPVMKVTVVGEKEGTINTFEGLKIIPDKYYGTNSSRPDILVIPSSANHLNENNASQEVLDYLKRQSETADYILTLCDGAFLAAEAGILDGKAVTTFPSDIKLFRQRYPAIPCMDSVSFVHDGNLITSVGGIKSYEAALYLCDLIYGKEKTRNIAEGLVIDWDKSSIKYEIVKDSLKISK